MDATTGVRGGQDRPDDAPVPTTPTPDAVAPVDEAPRPTIDVGLEDEPTRLLDFGLGSIALFPVLVPGVPGSLPVGVLALAALTALGLTRRPTRSLAHLRWLPWAAAGLVAYLVLVSVSGPDQSLFGWQQRAVRLVLVLTVLVMMVSGRLHFPSMVRGMALALVANAVLFYAGVAPAPYGRYLSGYLNDKNQAGLAYTVVGILLLGVTRSRWRQAAVVVMTAGLVWGTGSRTSLAALACALVWFALRPYLAPVQRLLLGGVFAIALPFVQENYGQSGEFADRVGTDWFRARIDAASAAKLDQAPWYGQGLGDAWIRLSDGATYFFHNSYWSLLIEGGWIYLLAVLVLTVWFGIRPLRAGAPPSLFARSAEAANVAVLICALRLGEVFGATTASVALAAGLIGYLQAESVGVDTGADPGDGEAGAGAGQGADTVTR